MNDHLPEDAPADAKEHSKKLAEELAQSSGKDHLIVKSTVIPNGSGARVILEPGVIKAIGAISPGGPAAQ